NLSITFIITMAAVFLVDFMKSHPNLLVIYNGNVPCPICEGNGSVPHLPLLILVGEQCMLLKRVIGIPVTMTH
ncbi:uncharacterized protein BJ212DRAFT_1379436, partial [Suillus subaureus]